MLAATLPGESSPKEDTLLYAWPSSDCRLASWRAFSTNSLTFLAMTERVRRPLSFTSITEVTDTAEA